MKDPLHALPKYSSLITASIKSSPFSWSDFISNRYNYIISKDPMYYIAFNYKINVVVQVIFYNVLTFLGGPKKILPHEWVDHFPHKCPVIHDQGKIPITTCIAFVTKCKFDCKMLSRLSQYQITAKISSPAPIIACPIK